ncbi:transglycosylase domain-containing protein, partial [Streptococcus danieliae]|nr:transglycosylase domain-containing protein [Streptococcus danieliae]
DIPLRMRQALLAIEDARFYEHGAVDFYGLTRATLANIVTGHHVQGASTITMQVARDFFLSREKTLQRKLTEMLLAYKLEQHYGKDKLLELYMNQIYLGERSYGFSAASNIYFDKPLAEVSIAEAAMLAGVSPQGADVQALAAALQKLGSDNVIITLGSKGVHAALYGGDYDFAAEVVQAVDTTAAGDTFIGGFVAGLASGMDEAESIQQGQRAAAWSVTKP